MEDSKKLRCMQVARKRNPQLVFILLELNSTSKLGCPLKIRRGSSRLPVSWHTRSDPHIVHTLPARGGTDKSSGKTVLLCNQHNPIYQWGSVVECNPNSYRCGVGNELLALSPDSPLPHSEMYQNHCKLHDICNTIIHIYIGTSPATIVLVQQCGMPSVQTIMK